MLKESKYKLIVISGPGGVGKDSVIAELCKTGRYAESISYTTRNPRPDEIDGKDYIFVNKEDFIKAVHENQILEWKEFAGNLYGSNLKLINKIRMLKHCVMDLNHEGALELKRKFPRHVVIIYLTCSPKDLEARLRARGDDEEKIRQRIDIAKTENQFKKHFDKVVKNKAGRMLKTVNIIDAYVNKVCKIKG